MRVRAGQGRGDKRSVFKSEPRFQLASIKHTGFLLCPGRIKQIRPVDQARSVIGFIKHIQHIAFIHSRVSGEGVGCLFGWRGGGRVPFWQFHEQMGLQVGRACGLARVGGFGSEFQNEKGLIGHQVEPGPTESACFGLVEWRTRLVVATAAYLPAVPLRRNRKPSDTTTTEVTNRFDFGCRTDWQTRSEPDRLTPRGA